MTQQELTEMVRQLRLQMSDDADVEAKACSQGLSKSVWESVSAFANTSGGILLLGIDEEAGFAPASGFDLARTRDQFVSGVGDGGIDNARLTNPPHYTMERVAFEDAQVLVIRIDENDVRAKPCFITRRGMQSGSYKRVDDKDLRLTPTEIFELQSLLVPSEADREPVPRATLDDLDDEALEAALSQLERAGSRSLRGARSTDERLRRLGVLVADGISLAGLLCFGRYPQQFFPRLVVDVAVHAGTQKAVAGAPRFLDREVCEGTVFECIEDALLAVRRNLRTKSVIKGGGRTDILEIPEEVLREAIANAVVHREYSAIFAGQPVSVDVFEDRIVVANPGCLWGGKTLETLDDGLTRCRNQLLIKLVQSIPSQASRTFLAEGQGSGIPMMLEEMRAAQLQPPLFSAGMDQFSVTLFRPGPQPLSTGMFSMRLSSRSASSEAVIAALSTRSPRSVREISAVTGLSLAAVRAHLKRLVDEGVVVATAPPTSKNRRYLLVQSMSTDVMWEMRA